MGLTISQQGRQAAGWGRTPRAARLGYTHIAVCLAALGEGDARSGSPMRSVLVDQSSKSELGGRRRLRLSGRQPLRVRHARLGGEPGLAVAAGRFASGLTQ